ncbi:MAG: RNA polymerase sigma-54 factor [Rickettsiales bacterium]|nr:RNA polymerase sigma-54 factor [Rickettsiales bacterium]
MQITQNLKLKQSQSLVMTPQLQQAIKLLQLNNLELTDLVNKELEENPFLENESTEEIVEDFDENTNDLSDSFESGESLKDEPKIDDYENRWDIDSNHQSFNKNINSDSTDAGSVVEQTLSERVSLKTILKSQAELEFELDTDKQISELLIDYIDPSGWITYSLDEISSFSGYELKKIEEVLLKMQSFEPNGVFARNLKECLILQLKNDEKLCSSKQILIENLELLGEGNLKELQKITNLKEDELRESIKCVRLLNPKPGTKYSEEYTNIFNPDVIVSKNNENWEVELNDSTLPKVTVNQEYINEIESLNCSDTDKKYINENLNSAKWLIKAIQQRNMTTLKISAEIVNQQKLFFEKGKKYLKPMILKDVAKKINMHESTVSRVTSEKLMLTPRGIFEMKLFFSASIGSTSEGESHSAASVRESLKKLISNEPMNSPFSDEILVDKLQSQGISLARRTVAKYRELLNIPSSSIRRRMMKIQNLNI